MSLAFTSIVSEKYSFPTRCAMVVLPIPGDPMSNNGFCGFPSAHFLAHTSISAFALAFPSTSPNDLGAYFSTHFNLMHPIYVLTSKNLLNKASN